MDPEVECYSRTHQVLMAIAGAGLVLYTFGYAWADFGVAALWVGHGWNTNSCSFQQLLIQTQHILIQKAHYV